ncbi:protein translocase subunit SecD [Asticcacaulis tiandongensis]|uniref:protein translocase subunit SecD n=1 Tax=Asticcacaulis tiandongensis TaxID=2565365 RepID=UPI00112DDE82|nr:protein translocase subunit SecD [Asticcacaulis tiandongensis]
MMELSRWKIIMVAFVTLAGIYLSLPNFLPQNVRDNLKGFVAPNTLNLGLDLQGGSELLLEVDTDALAREKTQNLTEDVRARLRDNRIAFSGPSISGDTVSVRISDAAQVDAAQKALANLSMPLPQNQSVRDVNITKGPDQTLRLTFTREGRNFEAAAAVDASILVVRKRIDNLGTKEPTIMRQGTNRIVVQAPGESDPEQLKRVIGTTAKLTFQMVDVTVTPADIEARRIPPGTELLPSMDPNLSSVVAVKKRIIVSGDDLTNASVSTDEFQKPAISFSFNSQGARKFGDATAANIGKPFAIILDGQVVSAPNIRTAITGGQGQITGNFTYQEASELVNVLKAGALPAPLNVEQQRTVGAELGADSVAKGQISTVVAFLSVLVFMVLAYGFLFGGISIVAILVNLILLIAAMSLTQATLTLPGIAGLILTLAMAVDANVLIYERVRDEIRSGRNVIGSLDAGFSRALETIIDANLTTLGAAIIMFFFGAGPVRGFAWTLSIGVLTSVFTAVFITQVLLAWWYRTKRPKTVPVEHPTEKKAWPLIRLMPQVTNFQFVKYAKAAGAVSAVLCVASVFFTVYPFTPPCGGLNCGVDFKGGTVLEMRTTSGQIDLGQVRSTLEALDLHDIQVQAVGSAGNEASIRFGTPEGNPAAAVDNIKSHVAEQISGAEFTRTEVVGPKVSGELMTGGVLALACAILLMMVYIWFRFEWQFGVATAIGLLHDVLLTFGLFALFNLEFTLTAVASILTIIGYSMNDTIVVFDRVRENLRKYKKMPLRDIVDLSLNETLSRTIMTGITTVGALLGLAVLGGDVLFVFAVALIFGVIIGTYSSIYVAAPIILLWGVNRNPGQVEVVDLGGHKPKNVPRP